MKRVISILTLAAMLATSAPLFAAESKNAAATAVKSGQAPKRSIFNRMSDFFSTFDRPFKRPGNKQGFCAATADWLKNIDKY
ncbi:MAG: hypothetical protein PHX20_04090 [Candidatus Omnitrophica bacterium]|nr:hypothetical protein [Candidatus Omnitrophota bacterium]MDD5436706.1 hypothetical protein [Candidatus Omnitrophota bacterium]